MTSRQPKPGTGIYLDQEERKYWVKRNDVGAILLEDEDGDPLVISPDHPALSDKELRVRAALDKFSK